MREKEYHHPCILLQEPFFGSNELKMTTVNEDYIALVRRPSASKVKACIDDTQQP